MKRTRISVLIAVLAALLAALLAAPPVQAQDAETFADQEALLDELGLTFDAVDAEAVNPSWTGLGLFSDDASRLLGALDAPVSGAESYAFGDDKSVPPIIDPGGANPSTSGAIAFTVPDGWVQPPSGFGQTMAFAPAAAGGVSAGDEVLMLWMTFDRPYDFSDPQLTINEGFPLTIPGPPVWNSSFAGDTWEGANLIPNAVWDGAALSFDTKGYDPDGALLFPLVDLPGFYYRSGDVMAMALHLETLEGIVSAAANHHTTAGNEGRTSTLLYTGGAGDVSAQRPTPLDGVGLRFYTHMAGQLFGPGVITLIGLVSLASPDLASLQFIVSEFVLGSSAAEGPVVQEPEAEQSAAEDPVVQEPEAEQSVAVDPVVQEPEGQEPGDGGGANPALIFVGMFVLASAAFVYRRRSSSAPGEEESPACDWGLVFHGGTETTYLKKPAPGTVECCTYHVKVESSVWGHDQAASFRQDISPERQYIPDIDFGYQGIGYAHHASTRSGPAGRQDWQHGDGDPIDQSLLDEDAGFWQRHQLEERPEVVAQIFHEEATRVRVWLESGCPDHENLFEARSDGEVTTLLTSECTNDAPEASCPVELTAQGLHDGTVFGDLVYGFGDWTGSDIDELERYTEQDAEREGFRIALPDPATVNPGRWDGHTHDTPLQTPTREQAFSGSDHLVKDGDRFFTQFNTATWCETAQLVPVAVYDTTERVSSHSDARFEYNLWLRATMKTPDCAGGQCGGHPGHTGHDAPTFEMWIDQGRQQIAVDGFSHDFGRPAMGDRDNPPATGGWERWELL